MRLTKIGYRQKKSMTEAAHWLCPSDSPLLYRMADMTQREEIKELVKEAVNSVLDDRSRVDAVMHREHHEAVQRWIERENEKARITAKVKAQIFGWGIISIISAVGWAVWNAVKFLVKE